MNSIDFNNDPLRLPGSTLNPTRYKLPSPIIKSPLELPSKPELPSKYNLPMIEPTDEFELPGVDAELEMQLGAIPAPYRNTVRHIHAGISPKFSNGIIYLSTNGRDIHHIVKRSYVKSGVKVARELLPFNGAIKYTFDLLTDRSKDPNMVQKYGGQGNMLINLIPLDPSFHHHFIEERPFDHTVTVKLNGESYPYTIPELLMSFNIFNLYLRYEYLCDYVTRQQIKCLVSIDDNSGTGRDIEAQKSYVSAWQQIQLELPRIPLAAEEIKNDHPSLFAIWESAIGPLYFRRTPFIDIEQ